MAADLAVATETVVKVGVVNRYLGWSDCHSQGYAGGARSGVVEQHRITIGIRSRKRGAEFNPVGGRPDVPNSIHLTVPARSGNGGDIEVN